MQCSIRDHTSVIAFGAVHVREFIVWSRNMHVFTMREPILLFTGQALHSKGSGHRLLLEFLRQGVNEGIVLVLTHMMRRCCLSSRPIRRTIGCDELGIFLTAQRPQGSTFFVIFGSWRHQIICGQLPRCNVEPRPAVNVDVLANTPQSGLRSSPNNFERIPWSYFLDVIEQGRKFREPRVL